jgi:uncharacterized protein (TIGR02271 family)
LEIIVTLPGPEVTHRWQGCTLVDHHGEPLGSIEVIYLDKVTNQPEWALVNTGLFGTKSTFVPLAQAKPSGDTVQVPYDKQLVKDAPNMDPDGHLSEAEEQQLWRHYGLDYGAGYTDRAAQARATEDVDLPVGDREGGYDTTGRTSDDAMTRSEEELQVGTEARERGRVRLRKYVTTEQEQVTVPVQREEVRVEREPITDANLDAATSGPEISEAEHEVVLHEEEPVVERTTVPRERVRLDTETVTDERQVSEEVRKEQIDVDDQGERGRPPR